MSASVPDPSLPPLLQQALVGDQGALGELLNRQQAWLRRMAEGKLTGAVGARLSASDVVQQTCLSAIRQFADFDGISEAQFHAWLQAMHQHNIHDALRRHAKAERRNVNDEHSLDAVGSAAAPLAPAATPSQRALQDEASAQLLMALTTLPPDQATAVRLRHLEQRSLREMAREMGRSEVAVASLLKRGLEALRQRLSGPADG